MAHPKIIRVDNQQARIRRVSQQAVGLTFVQWFHLRFAYQASLMIK
jgi:hypothetical protein